MLNLPQTEQGSEPIALGDRARGIQLMEQALEHWPAEDDAAIAKVYARNAGLDLPGGAE